jgi:hypothetical protein
MIGWSAVVERVAGRWLCMPVCYTTQAPFGGSAVSALVARDGSGALMSDDWCLLCLCCGSRFCLASLLPVSSDSASVCLSGQPNWAVLEKGSTLIHLLTRAPSRPRLRLLVPGYCEFSCREEVVKSTETFLRLCRGGGGKRNQSPSGSDFHDGGPWIAATCPHARARNRPTDLVRRRHSERDVHPRRCCAQSNGPWERLRRGDLDLIVVMAKIPSALMVNCTYDSTRTKRLDWAGWQTRNNASVTKWRRMAYPARPCWWRRPCPAPIGPQHPFKISIDFSYSNVLVSLLVVISDIIFGCFGGTGQCRWDENGTFTGLFVGV